MKLHNERRSGAVRRHFLLLAMTVLATFAVAADLEVPAKAVAHTAISIGTTGEGDGTLYLIGPAARIKLAAHLGDNLRFPGNEIRAAGLYTAILQSDSGTVSKTFVVVPGEAQSISFLAQPSRVATDVKDAISGTAFLRDGDDNLVLAPVPVTFDLAVEGAPDITRTVPTQDGVAWSRIDSSRRAGNAFFTATAGGASVRRVVQQVAAEPCNLRFHGQPAKDGDGILVQTDPVRDCSGNAVPDGIIVSFTEAGPRGRSTVDAVVKKGMAQALLPSASEATLSVASGVVSGNEIRWRGSAQ
jgi:hypothetical protein